ncbi:sugar porter family MFS transporter [Algoriphagus marinus]|uniref:sugar porter family MFS transporter n=1 Tax=Algoriphagus marinus TaxID=1925762 RepID=UPI00094B8301|nr:sugar porter family MFS transporter [Algoriphagus marinus]
MTKANYIVMTALIVALGGLLMGFDASVISGVVKFIEPEFNLTSLEIGWSVSSLTLTATLAMLLAGPLSDRYGRRLVLRYAAILYAVSAIASAFAPTFWFLVVARMIGGFGVGASLILAPMYIAEIAPPKIRGRMVSFNQLNIVIGISLAFFTNYLILKYGASDAGWAKTLKLGEYQWRWMLGLETLPAVLYFLGLFFVPKSPRWLIMKGELDQARKVMSQFNSDEQVKQDLEAIQQSIEKDKSKKKESFAELLNPTLRLVLTIGIVVSVLQQITGINSVFFYAPMIFEQSGIGTDASFVQAILVGLVNLAFTVLAILFIDKLGRKPLLIFGVAGIVICMFILAYGFNSATYTLPKDSLNEQIDTESLLKLESVSGITFTDDTSFKAAIVDAIGKEKATEYSAALITAAIKMNPTLILVGIIGFVASFAISIGPVMWVLFSELFPNWIRGIAISFVGLINSAVSFIVQLVFPWELEVLGSATTFLIYGVFALLGLVFIIKVVPETKGKSLEELEEMLVSK